MAGFTRRRLVLGATGLLAAYALPGLAGLRHPTPSQPAGPFYPAERPLDDDSDLTRVQGQERPAQGRISDVGGRILDRNGRPLSDLRIEIWQCDANGRYRHPRDSGDRPIDPAFQGLGHTVTDEQGRYRFRTIRPVPYPGRTPHIHAAVFPAGERPFITPGGKFAGDIVQLHRFAEPQLRLALAPPPDRLDVLRRRPGNVGVLDAPPPERLDFR